MNIDTKLNTLLMKRQNLNPIPRNKLAKMLSISPETIRHYEQRAIQKIRKSYANK